MISFHQISKVSITKGDISKREESQIVNGASFDTTSISDESYSKDMTSTFDTQHDNISIARLPSFYIPVNRLSSIEVYRRKVGGRWRCCRVGYQTSMSCLLSR